MASFGRQFDAASPILAMLPRPPYQAAFNIAGISHQSALPHKAFGSASFGAQLPSANLSVPPSISRKRSRDEAAENLEADVPSLSNQTLRVGGAHGPGKTQIKQTKDGVADEEARRVYRYANEKPTLRSSKSQRLDRGLDLGNGTQSSATRLDFVLSNNTFLACTDDPTVDTFTLHLGVGWRKISNDEHIQAAARGWARYIENHYPVTNAQIRLESKGLQSYLVEASEGFFLFAENLRHGRLVSHNAQRALQNLQSSPPIFDSAKTLTAAESPSHSVAGMQRSIPRVDAEMNLD